LGYKVGYKYSKSGGGDVAKDGSCVTGYIYVPAHECTFYCKNVGLHKDSTSGDYGQLYTFGNGLTEPSTGNNGAALMTQYNNATWHEDGNIASFTANGVKGKYIRLNAAYLGEDSIITCNEPIE
jgi:hypothetical protein